MKHPIYFGSIAIEPNRWKPECQPRIHFSEWLSRVNDSGFDGIELWQRHYTQGSRIEKERLTSESNPPAIFNSYATFENTDESRVQRNELALAILETRARAVKFNLGTDASREEEYIRQFCEWSKILPAEIQLLYECHPGDIGDKPDAAQTIVKKINNPNIGIIVHPFCLSPENLQEWFDCFPDSIRHLHVHQRSEAGVFNLLEFSPQKNEIQCKILRQRGFRGTLTVEFTKGTALERESPDEIFRNACSDLQFLRSNLS